MHGDPNAASGIETRLAWKGAERVQTNKSASRCRLHVAHEQVGESGKVPQAQCRPEAPIMQSMLKISLVQTLERMPALSQANNSRGSASVKMKRPR